MSLEKDDIIDYNLIQHLIEHIHQTKPIQESILVFMPGFDAITLLMEKMEDMPNHQLFLLHSAIKQEIEADVFDRPPEGARKIVLATNIAETSITIEDIVSR